MLALDPRRRPVERGEARDGPRSGAFRPATDEEIRAVFGAGGGSIGPVGVAVDVLADEALRDGPVRRGREPRRLASARRRGRARLQRRASPTSGRRTPATACPLCGGKLVEQTAIEVGHIFKLGTFYSVPFGRPILDEDGEEKPIVMGSYGIGPARTMAAIVEQHHDDQGIAVAADSRAVRRPRRRAPRPEDAGERSGRGCSTTAGSTCCSTTATRRAGREVRRRRSDRLPVPRDRRAKELRKTVRWTCGSARKGKTKR